MLEYRKDAHYDVYRAYYDNGIYLGEIYKEVDGFYVFWPSRENDGFWEWHVLHQLCNKLSELNAEWIRQIDSDLGQI